MSIKEDTDNPDSINQQIEKNVSILILGPPNHVDKGPVDVLMWHKDSTSYIRYKAVQEYEKWLGNSSNVKDGNTFLYIV